MNGGGNKVAENAKGDGMDNFVMDELRLIYKVQAAQSQEDRDYWIEKLERTPVEYHRFHTRWILINNANSYVEWTESGYDPTLSSIPRDIQLLAAVGYGKLDIENGGFHQFFTNGTGAFAPEMIEWFERAGFQESASVLREAVGKFGDVFPRSQRDRVKFLDQFEGELETEWDPFDELNERFYNSIKDDVYGAAADKWLQETCGISELRTRIEM